MIEEDTQKSQTQQTLNKDDFLDKLAWKEGNKGKWYLDKRECMPLDQNEDNDFEMLSIGSGCFDEENDESNKINEGITVQSELGRLVVSKVENDQVYLKMEEEEIPVPMDTVRRYIKLNFIVLGKTKSYLLENLEVSLTCEVSYLKKLVSEYLTIPEEIFKLFHNEKELSDYYSTILSLEINDGDSILVNFIPTEEIIYKRSGSKDYCWYDQKSVIPFTVDKNIVVSAFGFYRHYETTINAIYDFFLYEINQDGSKHLVTQLFNVTVKSAECDSEFVKKVNIEPVILKENVKYQAFVYFKFADMRTYFSYCGTADQTVSGVRFLFTDISLDGHKCSTTTGHLPYIYFKIANPYEA